MRALTWTDDLPVAADMRLRRATPDDAGEIAALMAEPPVERWWHQAWEAPRWARELTDLTDSPHSLPLVLCDDTAPLGYVEVYRVRTDTLGAHVEAEETDLGLHIALSTRGQGGGLGRRVIETVAAAANEILPGCRRMMAEPDQRNTRSHAAFAGAGFRPTSTLELPDKTAQLMVADLREPTWDVVAVGAGPFNLGLAALAGTVDDLSVVCLDQQPELTWHRGLMLDGAQLQVSFLADLVTLVDPTHPLSFLSYLRDQDRMYPFYVRERFHPTRAEYEDYLRWAARRLPSVRFGHRVTAVAWNDEREVFEVTALAGNREYRLLARHLVLGVGTAPQVPDGLADLPADRILHSGDYLHRIDDVTHADRVTVVGSGQSGAECVLDLLRRDIPGQQISWLTRSGSFAPLDYSKLVLEMTTPEYVDHFHTLPEAERDRLVAEQWRHYKGISTETLEEIHDALYARSLSEKQAPAELRQGVAVTSAATEDDVVLQLRHRETGTALTHRTDLVVAATGYTTRPVPLDDALERRLRRDGQGRLQVHRDHSVAADGRLEGRVFVANADLHTHGPAAPDLGIGAVRNATIINAVTGRTCYRLPRRTAFTSFGPTETDRTGLTRQAPDRAVGGATASSTIPTQDTGAGR